MNTTDATIQTSRIDTPMRFNIQITQHPNQATPVKA